MQAFIDGLEKLTTNADHQLSIADAVGMMADRELVQRENRRLGRLLTAAKLRYPDSCILGIDQLDRQKRRDILKVLEDPAEKQSTIITTQLPADQWHGFIGDNTIQMRIAIELLIMLIKQ